MSFLHSPLAFPSAAELRFFILHSSFFILHFPTYYIIWTPKHLSAKYLLPLHTRRKKLFSLYIPVWANIFRISFCPQVKLYYLCIR